VSCMPGVLHVRWAACEVHLWEPV